MQIITGSRNCRSYDLPNPVVTLGNFDGVHLGHQKILNKAIERARALHGVSIVYTFYPHPLNVLRPEAEPLKITTFEEKADLIEKVGIDYLICERFSREFADREPEEFVRTVICERINPCEIIIGSDYAFGKGRKGNVTLLEHMGKNYGYRVHVVRDITIKNIPVRSTTIRRFITEGRVSLAAKLLGSDYAISGTVVYGQRRRIGFPTANLSHIKDLVPANGIYAIWAKTPYGTYDGVVNIGVNPTFEGKKRTIEAHLFDFAGDLYGKEVTLYFVKRIRDERKFDGPEQLAVQIQKDIAKTKAILAKH